MANRKEFLRNYNEIRKRYYRGTFDVVTEDDRRRYLTKSFEALQERTRMNGNELAQFDIDSIMAEQRKKAILRESETGTKLVSKYLNVRNNQYTSPFSVWVNLNSAINSSYDSICQLFAGQAAVAHWIMDEIYRNKKTDKLIEILTESGLSLDEEESLLKDLNYPEGYLDAIARILSDRFEHSQSDDGTNAFFIDRKALHDGVPEETPGRELYRKIILLIPEDRIAEAERKTLGLTQDMLEITTAYFCEIEKRLVHLRKRFDAALDVYVADLKAYGQAHGFLPSDNAAYKKKANPLEQFKAVEEIIRNSSMSSALRTSIEPISDMTLHINQLEKITDEIQSAETLQVIAIPYMSACLCGNENTFREFAESTCGENIFKDIPFPPVESTIVIDNPYEIAFGVFSLLEKQDSRMYLCSAGMTLLYCAMLQVPWCQERKEKKKLFRKYSKPEVPSLFDGNMNKVAYVSANKKLCMSANQLVYALTGATAPIDGEAYKKAYRKLNAFDMPEAERAAVAAIAGTINEYYYHRLPDYPNEKQDEVKSNSEEHVKALHHLKEQIKKRKDKNDSLKAELTNEKAYSAELEKELELCRQKLADCEDELESTKELVDMLNSDEEEVPSTLEFPYITVHSVAIFGGYDKWVTNMQQLLSGDISYDLTVSSKVTREYVRSADIIAIFIKFISHPAYWAIVQEAKKAGKKIIYLNSKNEKLCASVIARADLAMIEEAVKEGE